MGYFQYYLLWFFASFFLRNPWLLLGVVVFLLLRRIIPDPESLFRAASRINRLKAQVELNRANVTARRDLAEIYLGLRRPKRALELLEEARERFPNDGELLYLTSRALLALGRYEEALTATDRTLELAMRTRFGQPHLVRGEVLDALGRYEEAAAEFDAYLADNGSDVAAYGKLAKAAAKLGRYDDAKRLLDEGVRTYRNTSPHLRRKQTGAWLTLQHIRAFRYFELGPLLALSLGYATLGAASWILSSYWLAR